MVASGVLLSERKDGIEKRLEIYQNRKLRAHRERFVIILRGGNQFVQEFKW